MSHARHTALLFATAACFVFGRAAVGADDIQVGDVVIDTPTLCCLGFSVPVLGDDNYSAEASIDFRESGNPVWSQGLPMLRVRPELTSKESPPANYGLPDPGDQFAGSLFGLAPSTEYEVRISVSDADGGSRSQTLIVSTRDLPLANPAVPRIVQVANSTELAAAAGQAQPGDVIELAPGTYSGALTVNANGTEDNPIIVRGSSAESVTIDAAGSQYGVSLLGEHLYLEHVTVTGSMWGARSHDTEGTVIRYSRFVDVDRGIDGQSGTNRSFYICDNVLEGKHSWPNTENTTWNDEGIAVTGEGHTVCFNTLSGFGDALGLGNSTSIHNRSIDFFGNDVLWTGDDGLELDYAQRNVRAVGNRIVNANMGASLQPVWGGPIYVIGNILLNTAGTSYKLNNDPSGFFIYHNTSIRSLGKGNWGAYAWTSRGYNQADGNRAYAGNFEMKNNILVGLSEPAYVTTDLILEDIDFNGWIPDGEFRFVDLWVNFADLQSNSPYENNGRVLDANTFSVPINLPQDYTTFWVAPNVTLGNQSLAIDAGLQLPNINDDYNGIAPDLGAVEFGQPMPAFGARQAPNPPGEVDTVPPSPPTNVSVE